MNKDELIEQLIRDALAVCCFDWNWEDDAPEINYTKAQLRKRFSATLAKRDK